MYAPPKTISIKKVGLQDQIEAAVKRARGFKLEPGPPITTPEQIDAAIRRARGLEAIKLPPREGREDRVGATLAEMKLKNRRPLMG